MSGAQSKAKITVSSYGVLRKSDGTLVAILTSNVKPPPPIECVRFSCLWKYQFKSWLYTLQLLYERYRIIYATTHRNDDIPMKYRTGGVPMSIRRILWEILKLRILGGK